MPQSVLMASPVEVRGDLGDPKVPALEIHTLLTVKHIRGEDTRSVQKIHNRVITDAFVAAIVDAMVATANDDVVLTDFNDFQWHGSGIGTTAEAATHTALINTNGQARIIGTKLEGATANIYKTVCTITYAGGHALTEHGVFNAETGGVMLDRTKFAAVSVVAADKVEFTYEVTFVSGS